MILEASLFHGCPCTEDNAYRNREAKGKKAQQSGDGKPLSDKLCDRPPVVRDRNAKVERDYPFQIFPVLDPERLIESIVRL